MVYQEMTHWDDASTDHTDITNFNCTDTTALANGKRVLQDVKQVTQWRSDAQQYR